MREGKKSERLRQFEIKVEDEIGKLADVCEIVAKAGVNIRAVATDDKDGWGIIKLITEDDDLTRQALKIAGAEFKEFQVAGATLRDKPGELAKVSRALSNSGIDIESVFLLGRHDGVTEIAFKVSDLNKALNILG